MASGSVPLKPVVRWTPVARASLNRSLERISAQDPHASALVYQRLLGALDVIALQPGIGTLTRKRKTRRFPIPKTGHAIEYRASEGEITVTRWIRQARVRSLS